METPFELQKGTYPIISTPEEILLGSPDVLYDWIENQKEPKSCSSQKVCEQLNEMLESNEKPRIQKSWWSIGKKRRKHKFFYRVTNNYRINFGDDDIRNIKQISINLFIWKIYIQIETSL